MSQPPAGKPTTVSLADEEGVKRIPTDTLFGLWATVNNLTRLHHFVLVSDTFIVAPGGIGVLALALQQTPDNISEAG